MTYRLASQLESDTDGSNGWGHTSQLNPPSKGLDHQKHRELRCYGRSHGRPPDPILQQISAAGLRARWASRLPSCHASLEGDDKSRHQPATRCIGTTLTENMRPIIEACRSIRCAAFLQSRGGLEMEIDVRGFTMIGTSPITVRSFAAAVRPGRLVSLI